MTAPRHRRTCVVGTRTPISFPPVTPPDPSLVTGNTGLATNHDPGSYPPDHHVLRDLAFTTEMTPAAARSGPTARGWITVNDHLRSPTGVTHPGALATLVDALGGGLAATAARPDWIATADLTLHLLPLPHVVEVSAVGQVVRAGRTTVVIEVTLHADGQNLGLATMSFAVLARRDGNPVIDQNDAVTRLTMALPSSGFTAPFETATGLTIVDAETGTVELPITDYVRNTLGATQGGMIAMTGAVAAERALTFAAHTPLAVVDLHITYLALARIGPVRSVTTVLEATSQHGTAYVELVDAGAEDKLTTIVRARGVRVP